MNIESELIQRSDENKCLLLCISKQTKIPVNTIQKYLPYENKIGPHKIEDFYKFFNKFKFEYKIYTKKEWEDKNDCSDVIAVENYHDPDEIFFKNCQRIIDEHLSFCTFLLFLSLYILLWLVNKRFKTDFYKVKHATINCYKNNRWYKIYDPNGKDHEGYVLKTYSDSAIQTCIEIN